MNIRQEQLYIQYLEMGESRTLDKLSQLTGYKLNTLNKYSQIFKWQDRVLADTIALNLHVKNEPNLDISSLSGHELLTRISRESQEKLYQAIKGVKVNNVRDAKVMLELSQLAGGKPTEIVGQIDQGANRISISAFTDILSAILSPEQQKEFDRRIDEELFKDEHPQA